MNLPFNCYFNKCVQHSTQINIICGKAEVVTRDNILNLIFIISRVHKRAKTLKQFYRKIVYKKTDIHNTKRE